MYFSLSRHLHVKFVCVIILSSHDYVLEKFYCFFFGYTLPIYPPPPPFAIAMTIGPFKWQGQKQKKKTNCVKYFAKILNNTNKMHKLQV
jgi:hypothetical protein